MAELRALAAELGLLHPRTLLQSGNLVFGASPAQAGDLAGRLPGAIAARFGVETPVILRRLDELEETIAANPFPGPVREDPGRLLVAFLSKPPEPTAVEGLRGMALGGERVEARGRELFIHYPSGAGASRLTQAVIDRRLEVAGTARNWNTVLALAALAADVATAF